MTRSQLIRMKAMDLAKLADEMGGFAERQIWKPRGGPVRKELLIDLLLERQNRTEPKHEPEMWGGVELPLSQENQVKFARFMS